MQASQPQRQGAVTRSLATRACRQISGRSRVPRSQFRQSDLCLALHLKSRPRSAKCTDRSSRGSINATKAPHHSCGAPARTSASLHVFLAATSNGARSPWALADDASKRDRAHNPAVTTGALTMSGACLCNRPRSPGAQSTVGEALPQSTVFFPHGEGQSSPGHYWDSRACGDLPGKPEIAWKQESFLAGRGATNYAAAPVTNLATPRAGDTPYTCRLGSGIDHRYNVLGPI
ncbi:hypothetical protein NDU88_001682 [Pleurodeles waltl]|uniref:Ig-like domain-containing protein n=1 Tax=Pleurodeles waltl TaxID=8319 RepID=A0AAV7LYB7_PLEWA|nr:hypothetical protein NDU88_001682 [Pleurodeles waltl]